MVNASPLPCRHVAAVFIAACVAIGVVTPVTAQQELWQLVGSDIHNTNAGFVGIGTIDPNAVVHFITNDNVAAGFKGELIGPSGNPRFQLLTASGTIGAPAPVGAGRQLGSVNYLGYNNGIYMQGARVAATTENVGAADMPTFLAFYTTPVGSSAAAERLRITSGGNVWIGGTTASTARLHVTGDAHFTGTVTGGNIVANYQDLAEWVDSSSDLRPGTVVVVDDSATDRVAASRVAYDTRVAGVISERPGIILGHAGESKEMVATTGRVRVRVRATRPIAIGDLLVTSDATGMAMPSEPIELAGTAIHRPGTLLGKALEPLASGDGEILVLLSLQ